jgi:hypothetical protein
VRSLGPFKSRRNLCRFRKSIAAHWNRRAAHFDEDFGHSIRTPAECAAWDRVLDLILPAAGAVEALDIGCGTGFLSLELAFRGHRVRPFPRTWEALAGWTSRMPHWG